MAQGTRLGVKQITKKRNKTLILYPFTISPREFVVDSTRLTECLSIKRLFDNKVEIKARGGVNQYSITVDFYEDGFVFGRFVKLKTDNIETIDKKTMYEDLQKIGEDKFIEQNAYFVWSLSTNLFLGQWNLESLNVLTGNSNLVLQNAISKCNLGRNIKIEPFPSKEFIQNIIENRGLINKYKLSFRELSKTYLEDYGMGGETVFQIAEDQSVELDIEIKLSQRKTLSQSVFDNLKSVTEHILPGTKKFIVYTNDGNFDLIGEKAIYYSQKIPIMDDLALYRKQIYNLIKKKLIEETNKLLKITKITNAAQQTLDIFP